ncbi:MAG: hypothetical protein MUD12_00640 [Spirochaetes bacterium]|jgi:hypothetical protein|nr:hypothetical protein [Spirochaetota bacterium]
MKLYNKILFVPLIILVHQICLCDEIFFKDSRVCTGKITEQTSEYVKYLPEGKDIIVTVLKKDIDRIIHSDVKETAPIKENGNTSPDTIYLADGSNIKGKINRIASKYILFTPEDARIQVVIPREAVSKIISFDGKTIVIK